MTDTEHLTPAPTSASASAPISASTSASTSEPTPERSRMDFVFSGEDPSGRAERDPAADRRRGLVWLAVILGAVAVGQILWPGVLVAFCVIMVILIPMVVFHEWGHYICARRFGVAVPEFFVGFGPRLWSFRRGDTEYGIKALFPAGGYVRISGMSQYEPVRPQDVGHTFRDISRGRRAVVLSAGSMTHFFSALVLLFVLLAFVGVPAAEQPPVLPLVGSVTEGSAAAAAGLRPGDRITAIDGQETGDWASVSAYLQAHPNQTVTIHYTRDGEAAAATATLGARQVDGRDVGFLGIGVDTPEIVYETIPAWKAVPEAFVYFGRIVRVNGEAVAKTFSASNLRCIGEQIASGDCQTDMRPSSVVGVANAAKQSLLESPRDLLLIIITLNIFVGLFNLLPLLPLDGGHLAVLGIEAVASKVRRRPVEIDQRHLIPITIGVMGLLMLLFVSSLYLDILNPVKLYP